jgi:hypothetical protein
LPFPFSTSPQPTPCIVFSSVFFFFLSPKSLTAFPRSDPVPKTRFCFLSSGPSERNDSRLLVLLRRLFACMLRGLGRFFNRNVVPGRALAAGFRNVSCRRLSGRCRLGDAGRHRFLDTCRPAVVYRDGDDGRLLGDQRGALGDGYMEHPVPAGKTIRNCLVGTLFFVFICF